MKSKIFKGVKLLAVMLLSATIFATNLNVSAVDKKVSVGDATYIDPLIGNVSFHVKTTSSGKYIYCIDRWKQVVKNTTGTLVGEKDAGFAYIVENGFPYKQFTGNKLKDYYITQSAIWWYIDEMNGNDNSLGKEFKTTASDKYNLRPYIKKLVAGAKAAKKAGYAKTSISVKTSATEMNLSSDGKYYVSNDITVISTNVSEYSVSVSNAPTGTIITDTNNNTKKTFAANQKFRVKVPASSVDTTKLNINVTVKANGSINKVYEYKPSSTNMQNFITAILIPVTSSVSDSLKLSASSSKVTIVKLDKATNKTLAGAKLVLKDSSGKVISSWTSTTNAHVIRNLANGTYTVEEKSAPTGYKTLKEPVKFEINDSNKNKNIQVKVYNETTESTVTIVKLDKATNKTLAGAKLVLKDSSGKVISSWTSTTNAHVIKNLENGTYTVEEESAPAGYKALKEPIKFEINDNNKDKNIQVKIYNEARESVVTITKIDKETEQPLAGAVLVVRKADGTEVARFTTTTEAYSLLNLENGTYTVEEESAPEGYKKSDDQITFTIDDNNLTHQITFENYKEIKVPYTGTSGQTLMTIIGIIIISSTIVFIYKNAKKAK